MQKFYPFLLQTKKNNLNKFAILDIDSSIAEIAIQNRKIKKIKLPDNLIASTAINYNLILVTHNVKDFKALNISLKDLFQLNFYWGNIRE